MKNQNSQNFTNNNKTSSRDTRESNGSVGKQKQPSTARPHMGTKKTDKHDQVPMSQRKQYDAKYSSGKSDAKKSAGLPQGTADKK